MNYLHFIIWFVSSSQCLWFRALFSVSPGQTPASFPIPQLKSLEPKPFPGMRVNPFPMRFLAVIVYFLFPETELQSPREPGRRIPELFRPWTRSFGSFEHNCSGKKLVVGQATQLQALSWGCWAIDGCVPESALRIIKAFFRNEIQLAP